MRKIKHISANIFIALLGLSLCRPLFAQQSTLRMFIWSNQLEPIISHKQTDTPSGPLEAYAGIVVDVLASFAKSGKPNIRVILLPRKRGELNLYDGDVDLTILSKQWVERPSELFFSEPIYVHREYLYATKEILSFDVSKLINNKYICIRRGYKFPNIDPYFESGLSKRVNVQEETTAFTLLKKKRCDYVLTNEYVANSIIKQKKWENIIYRSPMAVDEVDFTLAFHPKHSALVLQLNSHIKALAASGKLTEIIELHSN